MIGRLLAVILTAWLCALVAGPDTVRAAEDPLEGDLRDLRVGMAVDQLPAEGYVDLACGNDGGAPGAPLARWAEFYRCSPDAAGLHEVTFAFAESPLAEIGERWEGTKVAGHPVIPSLLIDDQGVVQGIRIVTDPEARMYLKKKAFLLSIRSWAAMAARAGPAPKPSRAKVGARSAACSSTATARRLSTIAA
jgi:hypothetical protein